jgi:hypothetical protein
MKEVNAEKWTIDLHRRVVKFCQSNLESQSNISIGMRILANITRLITHNLGVLKTICVL